MSWFQNIIVMPIVIGYLAQLLIEPDGGLELSELPRVQQDWFKQGQYITLNSYKMFYRTFDYTGPKTEAPIPTIALVHGYPSSSFDYHKIEISELTAFGNVLMYDHIGFGFSDKPPKDFTYSIFELADYSLMLFKELQLNDIILIAHDMGDTVTAEIVKRRDRGLLDESLNIRGVAFTNGGINFKYAKLRLAQWALRLPFGIGEGINRLFIILAKKIPYIESKTFHEIAGRNQLMSARLEDISLLQSMNRYNNGHLLLWKTIFYLNDRDNFEYSWHEAFTRVDFPVFVVWGDDDAVAPAIIGSSIAEIIKGAEHRSKDGVGHFLMLEDPKFWTESIVEFLSKVTK